MTNETGRSKRPLTRHEEARQRKSPGGGLMESQFIWLDGELVPFEDASVHFLSPTLHYGAGIFEGIRCWNTERGPALFRLHDHLTHFVDGIHILGFGRLAFGLDDLRMAVHRTVHANQFDNCYVRMLMYLQGPLGLDLNATEPTIGVAAWRWRNLPGTRTPEAGVRMMVSSLNHKHPNAGMSKARVSGKYVSAMLAKSFAMKAGFDEAAVLDADGHVVAGTSEDLAMVVNGQLIMTPAEAIVEGIVRDTVITLAGDLGIPVREQRITRDQLYIADELFVCGTANGIVPIREVDFRRVGTGRMGPITRQLQSVYLDTVHGKTERSRAWLDYVMSEPLY